MNEFFRRYRTEIAGSVLCLGLGFASGYGSNAGDSTWYASLVQPKFSPPAFLFAPVWTILYILMGIALGKIWRTRRQHPFLLILFCLQFLLNLLWSSLFFVLQRIDLALYDLSALWCVLLFLLWTARRQRALFVLLLPYFLWVSFAFALNFSFYRLN